jgi:hypothetical protein
MHPHPERKEHSSFQHPEEAPMTRFAEVTHQEWIGAPIETVRSQFADLDHHISANVHPRLRFQVMPRIGGRERYLQEVKLLGLRQRDVFERVIAPDGTMTDTAVEGFNKGGSLVFRFAPAQRGERAGTHMRVTVRLPVPRLLRWLTPVLEAQVRRELLAGVEQDKYDIEVRGYQPRARRSPMRMAA